MQTVVITGASSGIGRDAAVHFNELGFTVYAGVRRLDDGERVRAAAADPRALHPLVLDVTDADQVASARDAVAADVGSAGLTSLVSKCRHRGAVGTVVLRRVPTGDTAAGDGRELLRGRPDDPGVSASAAGEPAHRGLNSALMAHTVIPFNAGYAASKAALEARTDSLRREVAPLGVKVAMVEAAYIASELERKQQGFRDAASDAYPLEAALREAAARASRRLTGRPSAAPRRVAEVMADAVRSPRPRPRRIVGTGARPIWTVGCLPDRAQDVIFRVAFSRLARRR
jgi:NADP-dependent 3-hydroxy acid dehydrogenase YdfG